MKALYRGLCLVALLTLGAAAVADPPAEQKVKLDIAAQRIDDALYEFGRQSGLQVFLASEEGKGVVTPRVAGTFTVEDALGKLLSNTGLRYEYLDARTIAIRPAKSAGATPVEQTTDAAAKPIGPQLQLAQSEPAPEPDGVRDGQKRPAADKAENAAGSTEIIVTGSRIRGAAGEQTVQPVLVITARDIQRYGVSSLGDVLRYIPQVSSYSNGQTTQTPGLVSLSVPSGAQSSLGSARVTASLRGAPAGGTLLLINGRRTPKSGQQNGTDGYDLGGIPLAAVERIEVLLDGASAVYGADAVGGVINVILKRDFSGTQARLGIEDTFDGDSAVRTAGLSHGFSARGFSGFLAGSWEEADTMMWSDRPFLSTLDRRAWGGRDFRPGNIDGRGRVSLPSAQFRQGQQLPGIGMLATTIPEGSTGTGLTPQDYAAAGPLPDIYDPAGNYMYSTPYRRKSLTANVDYVLNQHMTAFTELRWGDSRTWSTSGPIGITNSTSIPATAPGNPFGVPVGLDKRFFDLPDPVQYATTENNGAVLGLRGELPHGWSYESTLNRTVGRSVQRSTAGPSISAALLAAAWNSATPPLLFYDSTSGVSPNAPGTIEALTVPFGDAERDEARIADVKMDGTLWALPAGDVRMAAGIEYREEYVDFPLRTDALAHNRYSSGAFAEVRVPLISGRQGWALVDRLELSAAVRHDRFNDFDQATNPRYGILYRPVHWLMFRASYGEGYKVATLSQLYGPSFALQGTFPGQVDRLRGNEAIVGTKDAILGGNPDLQPERSENTTAGMVFEVPFIDGLSLTLDYYRNDYVDRVGSISLTEMTSLFPERITRGPNLSTDPAGWAGPITGADVRPVNVAMNRIAGYDFGARYSLTTRWGELSMTADASRTTLNEVRNAPGAAADATVTRDSLPTQFNSSLFWSRGPLETGVLFTRRDPYRGTNLATAPFTPAADRLDWQGSYDFGRSGVARGGSWGSRMLEGTRLSVTIFNVFNDKPPIGPAGMPDNTVLDSRLRRYSINLTRDF